MKNESKTATVATSLVFIAFIAALTGPVISLSAYGGDLPVEITFDDDQPGTPPSTGGTDQPTSLYTDPGTSILVDDAANGVITRPVVVTVNDTGPWVDLVYAFDPISDGRVRVEATVAFDRFSSGIFAQTLVQLPSTAVITRLQMLQSGIIRTQSEIPINVGNYVPNEPFRFRMDIDMTENNYSVVVDSNLNGFEDDPILENLLFINDPEVIPNIATVKMGLHTFGSSPNNGGVTTVAYDDIAVSNLERHVGYSGLNVPLLKAAMDKKAEGK